MMCVVVFVSELVQRLEKTSYGTPFELLVDAFSQISNAVRAPFHLGALGMSSIYLCFNNALQHHRHQYWGESGGLGPANILGGGARVYFGPNTCAGGLAWKEK